MEHTEYIAQGTTAARLRRQTWALPFAAVAFLLVGLWNISGPTLWWDEGWTLSVARTWVERGHYGRLSMGQVAPPGLEAAFPTTSAVALSFRLFGVGVWQGRLVGVVFTLGALALMYALARRLYNRTVAGGALAVLLVMSMHPQLHPLIVGRQVLAEMPMLFYLLAGYAGLLGALRGSRWLVVLVVLVWSIALMSKAQALPFWVASLLLPLLVALVRRWRRAAGILALALVGSLLGWRGLLWLQHLVLQPYTLPPTPLRGLYSVIALVPYWFVRVFSLQTALTFGLPTLLGSAYSAWQWLKQGRSASADRDCEVLRLALWALVTSWFAWFALLSIGTPRYLFPATFVGSLFVAVLLYDLTERFNLAATLQRSSAVLRSKRLDRQSIGAWLALLLVAMGLPLTTLALSRYYISAAEPAAFQVAHFLNTQTPSGSVVETYDSELHFLLQRPYHYPPDQIHIDLIRQSFGDRVVPINYDPLVANPDYLVVGSFIRKWRLYDPVLASGAFRLVQRYGEYDVYQRVR